MKNKKNDDNGNKNDNNSSSSAAAAVSENREMKPPAIDMSSLFGMMAPGGALPVGNATFPVPSRTTDVPENRITELVTKPNQPPAIIKPVLKRTDSAGSSVVSSLSSLPAISEPKDNITKVVSVETSQSGIRRRGRGKNKITSTAENTISI